MDPDPPPLALTHLRITYNLLENPFSAFPESGTEYIRGGHRQVPVNAGEWRVRRKGLYKGSYGTRGTLQPARGPSSSDTSTTVQQTHQFGARIPRPKCHPSSTEAAPKRPLSGTQAAPKRLTHLLFPLHLVVVLMQILVCALVALTPMSAMATTSSF